ncbi:hypothetical protein M378DRAFT_162821 [Amanita muscaria Koide BX008]|uniref:Uncharacterized protein n=1 Tax=Amanita muscaria (strain Koide BX008) TaxID=946122 RepID=A0A0C2SN89_AMAMK|nr:hypothetical protein M378DRAFT_162821 [Amanita muscaria Koide BX008]
MRFSRSFYIQKQPKCTHNLVSSDLPTFTTPPSPSIPLTSITTSVSVTVTDITSLTSSSSTLTSSFITTPSSSIFPSSSESDSTYIASVHALFQFHDEQSLVHHHVDTGVYIHFMGWKHDRGYNCCRKRSAQYEHFSVWE